MAARQRDLLLHSTFLMLLIIVPVMALTVLFAWRYRQSNRSADYAPEWEHSTQLELVIWGTPLMIIICLGAITWMGTHLLDPYRALDRKTAQAPLQVEAVALDWKWLFIYPQYGVATVNELAAPVGRPISFHITSASVMNSLYIPALAGQIYAMPGMETRLHGIIDKPGSYRGFSANYSGAGFSGMHFVFQGQSPAGFQAWIARIKARGGTLDRAGYMSLARPSQDVPVMTYATVDGGLYSAILNLCVQPGKMCVSQMAALDAKGGLGLAGARNVLPLVYDKFGRPGADRGVAALCAPENPKTVWSEPEAVANTTSLRGAGLPLPSHDLFWNAQFAPSTRPTHSQ